MTSQILNNDLNQIAESENNIQTSSHWQKILYALGIIPYSATYYLLSFYFVQFYFSLKHLNKSNFNFLDSIHYKFNLIFSISSILFCLIIGYISDISRFKIGRRTPFLLIGAISYTILFILFWILPKNLSMQAKQIHFYTISILFSISQLVFFIPYLSIFPDIAKSPKERLEVSIYFFIFNIVSCPISLWLPSFLISIKYSFILIGILTGIFNLILMILSILGSYKFDEAITSEAIPTKFFNSILNVFRNRTFFLFMVFLCSWELCSSFISKFNYKSFDLLIRDSNLREISINYTRIILSSYWIIVLPFIIYACFKVKWCRIIWIFLILALIFFPIGLLISEIIFFSVYHKIVISIIFTVCLFPNIAIHVLLKPIIANFIDQDTIKNNFRRAGIFFGALISITSAASKLSSLFVLGINKLSNFIEGNKLGFPTGPITILTIIIAIFVFFIFSNYSSCNMDINNKI